MFEAIKFLRLLRSSSEPQSHFENFVTEGDLPGSCNGVRVTVDELAFYQTHGKRWQPPAKSLWSQLNGQHASQRKGRGMTFSEVRQYQAGDDVRQIDWRVTARTGKVHTKLFTEERERPVVLFIDLTPSMFTGTELLLKSVQLCHLASLLGWIAIGNKDRVGAVIRTPEQLVEIRPSGSRSSLFQLLHHLCEMHNRAFEQTSAEASYHHEDVFRVLTNLCSKGSELILLSDFSDIPQSGLESITRLAQHNRVRAIQLYDPIELGQSRAKGLQKVQGKVEQMSINLSSQQVRASIKRAFLAQQNTLETQLGQYGIALSQVSSGEPLLKQLLKTHY
ncbi:DUF58 domain-containing protein [Vibrio hangzhouensis]|uniref:DUF58 domain-containing protein n=1 Tax=Vibrio hangzhouensis TaxID=462991 RepID=UPI001C98CCED|nr:DUF58 domain-containing protein [Vibrio hangzhouensis]MBY6198318.1 DUF58 domain-containing protein [Vibrio hangzhouensis]